MTVKPSANAVAAAGRRAGWALREGEEIAPGRSVVRRLGGGNRYEVYLAWEERMRSLVVVKLLRPDRTERVRSRRALEREAELLERLAHPVLLRGFAAVAEGPRPHLVLEHLEAPTLRSILRHGPVSNEQLLPIAVHLAGVLHYLTCEGVVHLDVKPDNVMVGVTPRVIDLSLARSVEQAAAVATPVGTFSYMAPEQCDPVGRGPIGPPSDVWGLGATLYHAASGRKPFARGGSQDREAGEPMRYPQLEREPAPLPSFVPAELSEAIMACLAPDPAERPTAAELANRLEPVSAGVARRVHVGRRGAFLR
jgi:serine/threonine protein kinase